MKKIKFIYFDVGGVSLLDFSSTDKWEDLMKSIGVTDQNKSKYNKIWDKYKNQICLDYDVDSMIDELNEFVGLKLDKKFSFLKEFIKRFDPNQSIWPVIKYAKKNYEIGLLTSMYPRMLDSINKKPGLMPKVEWDVIVDSSIVKMQKPDPYIYNLATKLANVKNPSEILFVDNVEKNLVYPREIGWQTFLYDTSKPDISSVELFEKIQK